MSESETKLNFHANHDPLPELSNRYRMTLVLHKKQPDEIRWFTK